MMPKISYIDKAKQGFDDTKVIAFQIQQKMAEINALLRGMIDEDNLMFYDGVDKSINIPPSKIIDMPLETRPVNHCMKFFGYVGSDPDMDESIIATLYNPLIDLMEHNPDFVNINGIGDKEVIFEATFDSSTNLTSREMVKTISVEIPSNYSPLNWNDLWNYIYKYNPEINLKYSSDGTPEISGAITDVQDFLDQMRIYENGQKMSEVWFEIAEDVTTYFDKPEEKLTDNIFEFTASVIVPKTEGSWLTRIVPSILCRIN